MLLTSKASIKEAFPKEGAFFAVWHDIDTNPQPLNDMSFVVPYTMCQFVWHDGVLYEEEVLGVDDPNEIEWRKVDIDTSVDFLHSEAKALGFFVIPNKRLVF